MAHAHPSLYRPHRVGDRYMIRGLIFDLDGVLVDAAQWHYEALNRSLSLFGYSIDEKEHEQRLNGLPTLVKLQILSRQNRFPAALHSFVNEMKQRYTREFFQKECRPRPALTAALLYFRSEGYRLAVASNSARATVDMALSGMGIAEYFDVILSHEDVGKPKPDPAIFLECFRRMELQPSETLILEDSEPGIRAARDSTAPVLIVQSPSEVTLENILRRIQQTNLNESCENFRPTIEILIPMAGKGQRFVDAGFMRPKPFISVMGRPMIEWVVENVRPQKLPYAFTFLVNEDHLRQEAHKALLQRIAPGCRIVPVPSTTQGAACTALLASDTVAAERPLLVVNSDQWVDFCVDDFLAKSLESRCDGNILTFPASDEKWSYARTDLEGNVIEVAEKRPISPHATVGIYYFRQAKVFAQAAQDLIRRDDRTNGEFYLCPVYNQLIAAGGKVRIEDLPENAMHGLGTPSDLDLFLRYQLKASEHFGLRER